jgi:hypothetical protein
MAGWDIFQKWTSKEPELKNKSQITAEELKES